MRIPRSWNEIVEFPSERLDRLNPFAGGYPAMGGSSPSSPKQFQMSSSSFAVSGEIEYEFDDGAERAGIH